MLSDVDDPGSPHLAVDIDDGSRHFPRSGPCLGNCGQAFEQTSLGHDAPPAFAGRTRLVPLPLRSWRDLPITKKRAVRRASDTCVGGFVFGEPDVKARERGAFSPGTRSS